MGIFHYLNVKDGDCSIIQHPSGRVTVFDVCNARADEPVNEATALLKSLDGGGSGGQGNFNQKAYPVNPIRYMKERNLNSVFRFIASHPEMDHLDGFKDFFEAFDPTNFWDTNNKCEKDFTGSNRYRQEDWDLYRGLRDGTVTGPTRLALYAGARAKYYNCEADGTDGGDGLHILSPTKALLDDAIERGDYNDACYVVLYRSKAGRVLLTGDAHDKTMAHLIANHRSDIEDIDLLIAPHHGRDSDRSYDFLDVMRPKLTFFGNAASKHLAYSAWNNRGLPFITNNQADCMVVDTNGDAMAVYVTNQNYALRENPKTFFSPTHRAYFLGYVRHGVRKAA